MAVNREQRTENRERRTKNREQRTENREQRTENREQRTENREQRTENREQRTENKKAQAAPSDVLAIIADSPPGFEKSRAVIFLCLRVPAIARSDRCYLFSLISALFTAGGTGVLRGL
jgi:hypothetical protein